MNGRKQRYTLGDIPRLTAGVIGGIIGGFAWYYIIRGAFAHLIR
jgi:hypothetical protein